MNENETGRTEWHKSPQELKEYSLDLFERLRFTLLDGLTLEDMPDEDKKEAQKTLDSVERTLELLRNS